MSKRHERLLFRYSSALEHGDFETVADVLREAERDPALEQMILDMNDVYSAERFNHTNPKEIPMIAALYQNPKPARSRANWQGLPFVAALAVVALLTVMLAVQTRGSTPMNSGGNDAPAAQITPYCSGVLVSSFTTVPLYSRPALDAPVVTELQYANNAGHEIVVLDVTNVDGETWVFVRVPSSPDILFGWTTEAQFRTMVADCQPTVEPLVTLVMATATPVPGVVLQPLVVTLPSDGALVTVITAMPVPFVIEPSPLPPTVIPPAQDAAATSRQFMSVYVQPGDTLISVLRRFNIDLDRIPELIRINNLTDDSIVTGSAELPPGTILLVPLPNLGSLLTCTLQAQEQVDVLAEDSEFAPVVMTLQAGDSLDVFTQPIGDWYAAIVHQDGTTMSSVYVRIHDIEQLANCRQVTTVDADPMPLLVITATPVPFGDEPTAQPPTVVPPIQVATATPFPTPTLAR